MNKDGRGWVAITAAIALCAQLAGLLAPAVALAESASGQLKQGQEYYEQSRFDEVITLLKDLVDHGSLSGIDLLKARELLARSYVKKGYPALGKDTFKDILRSEPSWRPDPIRVPPDETAVFEQALTEFQAESKAPPVKPSAPPKVEAAAPALNPEGAPPAKKKGLASKWWVWAIGAGVVGGVAAAAAGGGGGGGSHPAAALFPAPFPSPPNH